MKTAKQLQAEQKAQRTASLKSNMREHAMRFREMVAPDSDYYGSFSQRMEGAANYLRHAITYLDLANRRRIAA